MPTRDILIVEASSMILEPISQEMTYAVLTRLGLKNVFEDNVYITNDFTKPSITSEGDGHNALIPKDRCDVKMTTIWNPHEVRWGDVNSFNHTQAYGSSSHLNRTLVPVFFDGVADVRLVEQQVPCSMALEFSLQFKNREAAFMTISAINNTSIKDSVINIHNLCYNYPISQEIIDCLYQVYFLRKDYFNMDFSTYLKRTTRGAAQYLKQRTGDKFELVIKRQHLKAMGVLEYSQSSPGIEEQDRGVNRFIVDFSYTIQFARPDALRLSFPVVICNKMIPHWMLSPRDRSGSANIPGIFQEKVITRYLKETRSVPPPVVRFPEYDDFTIPLQHVIRYGFRAFFCAAVLLDDEFPTKIDLLNLGEVKLHAKVVEIMKLQGIEVFSTNGLINMAVYCNDMPVNQSLLSIDENLVISVAMSDKTRRYHLVISEATDLHVVDVKWFKTLIEYRTFFPITIVRNLQLLIDKKYCYIDNSNAVLQRIDSDIRTLKIDSRIEQLITDGHLTHYAYSHATTAEQFCQYLIEERSPVTGGPVYDVYVEMCISLGLFTENQLTTGYIIQTDGLPFLSSSLNGKTGTYNTPLRIINATVRTTTTERT